MATARRLRVTGVVQGVGFRPHVAALGRALGLGGQVRNLGGAVEIEVEGPAAILDEFVERLVAEAPAAAHVDALSSEACTPRGRREFTIGESDGDGLGGRVAIGPDLRVCAACLAEVGRAGDRRSGYAFTSCTGCGPRLTIADRSPWDRATSAMREFALCVDCAREAADPDDRRWHAEAIACPRCGPSIWIEDLEGRRLAAAGAPSIAAAAELLRRGEILGLQGVGGFQLLVDARREDAVQRLRARKRRPAQPLALMVRDLEGAAALLDLEGEAGAIARAALVGREGPIVLARRRSGPGSAAVAPSVAPDEARLGVMLATTPAHALLLEAFGGPVVATSGNVHERPIVITVDDARGALAGVAVALLVHNRPILRRCDDSVIQIAGGRPRVLRLGRGLAPARFALPGPTAPLLALGGHLAQAPVLATHGEAIAWPHVGDLDDADARAAMAASQADLCRFVGVDPQVVAVDAHPDYATTLWAREREREGSPRRIMPVHHHHAHVAAVLAEHGRESALGVAWDGVGMGEDRGAWGGEFLAVDPTGSRRLAWVWPYPLPGGDAAARDGLRPLAGLLVAAGLPTPADVDGDLPRLCELAARSRLAPTTSSVGRLFDAIACLVGLRRRSEYQAQAARALEHAAADHGPAPAYPFALDGPRLDWRPMLAAAIADRGRPGLVAARLHATLVAMIVAVVERHRSPVVALAGGCFANTILLEGAIAALEARGIEVLAPARAPPGDGGLALGQAWVASHRLRAEARSNADAEET